MVARRKLYSVILLLTLTINPLLVSLNIGQTTQLVTETTSPLFAASIPDVQYELNLLYDPDDEVSRKTVDTLHQELANTELTIHLEPIRSIDRLESVIRNSWMNIYIFHGVEEGICIDSDVYSWRDLGRIIEGVPNANHIFESCHSDQLERLVDDEVSVFGLQGQIDAKVGLLGVLCQIYDILDRSDSVPESLVSSVFDITAMYFLTNINNILQRSINPVEPMDGFEIDYGQNETDSRGPWGWLIDVLMAVLLVTGFDASDWYNSDTNTITFDTTKIDSGANDGGKLTMEDMGNGNDETGEFPFDIPLEFGVTPRVGSGPWYMPEYVDLTFTIQAKDGKLDLAEVLGLKKILEAAGYDIALELTPKLSATLRIGNFISQIANANPTISDNPFKFMGGSFSIELGFEFGIPLATFLDYVIPGTGTTVSKIMKLLNIKVNLVNYLSLALGMNYNSTTEASQQDVTLKAGFGLDISISLPSPKEYIKKAIGISLPVDFIELGAKLKATTGILAKASFGHKGDSFSVGLFYKFFFKFYASIFWIFKFSVTKQWEDSITFPLIQSEGSTTNPPSNDHGNLDLDGDGLWDDLEKSMGLDPKKADTDGDSLSDGNELLNYFSDPLKKDTDSDGLDDDKEMVLFYNAGLDPLADYDKDGKPCIMDADSDNDGMNDKEELVGINSGYMLEIIKTNPSLPDTDFDGFTDSEEWAFSLPGYENPHPDPRNKDTDSDGLLDKFEYDWWDLELGYPSPLTAILTTDVDKDMLNDGLEYNIKTSPFDIDSDDDFDLDNDQIVNATELARAFNTTQGNFTDYGEYYGNYFSEWPWGLDDCKPPNPTPTNPLRADTDGDGDSDVVEYKNSTLPCLYDSDGDGLENVADFFTFHANCTDPDNDDDYIRDGDEVRYFNLTRGISNETIASEQYLNDSDVDDDGLLDGLEFRYGCDPLNNDSDSDGLSDGNEVELGTYPLIQDSDGDSLLDGAEIWTYQTDPLRQDSDNDGLSDDFEVEEQSLYILNFGEFYYFTDPNDPDSDNDSLTDGEEYYGWNWALDRRVGEGSLTITEPIMEEGEEDILNVLYSAPDPYRARFQTHPMNNDTDFDGLWDGHEKDLVLSPVTMDTDYDGWPDVEEIEYMVTRMGKSWDQVPDIWHYLDYDGDGLSDLNDFGNGTDVLLPDTDLDGLDDWTEVNVPVSYATEDFGMDLLYDNHTVSANTSLAANKLYTNPLMFDTDEDGLSDYWELFNGTNPLLNDTDQDGLLDYEELYVYQEYQGLSSNVLVTLDPLSNDTDADGIYDYDEVVILEQMAADTGISAYGPLGDFDNDGMANIFDYDSDSDGIYDGFELFDYQDTGWSWYPLGTDMFDSDQDLDGIIDGMFTDRDEDGLSDNTELNGFVPGYTYTIPGDENTTYGGIHILNHTLCILNDTDFDGFDDGWEMNFGSDPLNPFSYPQIFRVDVTGLGHQVDIASSSSVENLEFNQTEGQLDFDVSGPDGTLGFCNISIPMELLNAPLDEWEVLLDEDLIDYVATSNETMTWIFFEYEHSVHHITIRGTEALQPGVVIDPVLIAAIAGVAGLVIIVVFCLLKKKKT